ncbi:MAG: signal recognition particle-docking protein FtsY [Anaerovoracaceae bacterium]|jgi:fused signal recognition particle receptor
MQMHSEKKKSFFGRLTERLNEVFTGKSEIDDELMDSLEEILITSDMGMETTMHIMDRLEATVHDEHIKEAATLKVILKKVLINMVDKGEALKLSQKSPLVILMIGINGGGKTTTIGKIAYRCQQEGKSVLLAAADTFRAAAGEQLEIWGERIGVPVIKHQEGADPSAVLFDACQSAKARGTDVLICDTAGRLQNKKNLMTELEKMNKVIDREFPEADRETLLVLDATTGKNAVSQVREFGEVADLTGVILTKLDGTAKGGIAVTIAEEFDMPIKFVGVGEKLEDLEAFDPAEFIGGIFDD